MGTVAGILETDHTFWLTVETAPPGVTVCSVPDEDIGEQVLGVTPCTLAVDLNWESRWFRKRWELISVRSPGGFCRPAFSTNEGYRLSARFTLRKEGWKEIPVEATLATLTDPGKDWSGKAQWPTKQTLRFALEAQSPQSPAAAPAARPAPRRVVLAGAGEGSGKVETGRVTIFCDTPGAEILVDGYNAGALPVELLLRAGSHVIEVSLGPRVLSRREIRIDPDASLSLEVSPRD
ncbi:MAG: PEGA domain-containing protein [Kiritimatiellae bacterium]|nr:PEGA domain-containing protein [Kiritimatiellia bacterium]